METVTNAKVIGPYTLELTFSDGTTGTVNLQHELHGQISEPLRDRAYFAKVTVDQQLGTIVWPNGADFSPEFLYDEVRGKKVT